MLSLRGRVKHSLFLLLGVQALAGILVLFHRSLKEPDHLPRPLKDELPRELYNSEFGETVSTQHRVTINERKEVIRDVCTTLSGTNYWDSFVPTGNVWTYKNISYCIVPKAGCTFWKRAFMFLAEDSKHSKITDVSKPSDIDRFTTHYGTVKNITLTKLNKSSDQSFMFARNPYTRLWSVYMDKFLLPDYWLTSAVQIAKFMRSMKHISTEKCVNDITFEEFLTYITFHPVNHMNEHWAPVHRLCSPCHVTFDIIGKVETFEDDSDYIIDKYDLHAIDENQTKETKVKSDIDMLIKYNFDLYQYWYWSKDCYDLLNVAKRLWYSFQLNGFIHTQQDFPEAGLLKHGFHGNPSKVLSETVHKAIDSQTEPIRMALKAQKSRMMMDAYRSISGSVMQLLKEIYRFDFLLFQYDDDLDALQVDANG